MTGPAFGALGRVQQAGGLGLRAGLLALALLLAGPAYAAPAGTVTQLAGVLTARKADGVVKILGLNSAVDSGDLLATGLNTYARVKFTDGGDLTLRPNTQLRIDQYKFQEAQPEEDNAFFRLLKGGLRAVTGLVGKRNGAANYRMATPTATIGIRGTNYGVLFCQSEGGKSDCEDYRTNAGVMPLDGLHVDVADGRIVLSNPAGAQELAAGQFAFVRAAETAPVPVPANQGVTVKATVVDNKGVAATVGTDPGKPADFECTID